MASFFIPIMHSPFSTRAMRLAQMFSTGSMLPRGIEEAYKTKFKTTTTV
jgi:hypothetical protein